MSKKKNKEILHRLYPSMEDSTLEIIVDHSEFVSFEKGTALVKEGDRHLYGYFIVKGAMKAYYLKDGKEVCTWFAFENEFIGTLHAFEGLPSKETLELIEDSELIRFQLRGLKEVSEQNLAISLLVNEMMKEEILYLEDRLNQIQFMTSKERYERLLKKEPYLLQRVSLTDIASFLGISRETLSRIRSQS